MLGYDDVPLHCSMLISHDYFGLENPSANETVA